MDEGQIVGKILTFVEEAPDIILIRVKREMQAGSFQPGDLVGIKSKSGETLEEKIGKAVFTLFIDGACSGNPGPGGWGAVASIWSDDGLQPLKAWAGYLGSTTNQKAELIAFILGVENLFRFFPKARIGPTLVVSDSQYLTKGIHEWMKNWEKEGRWAVIENAQYWLLVKKWKDLVEVTWAAKGSHPGLELADTLARRIIEKNGGEVQALEFDDFDIAGWELKEEPYAN